MLMAEASFLDPSNFHNFPEFNPSDFPYSDPNLFSGAELPLPDGLTSDLDLDLDDIDLDFSVDDLILSPSEGNDDGSIDPQSNSNSNIAVISNPESPVSGDSSAASVVAVVVDQQVKQEDENNSWRLKRKKDDGSDGGSGDLDASPNPSSNAPTSKNHKLRLSEEVTSSCTFSAGNDEDDKRKARLMRNRESAQLSRQRKKHYIEELEEKVKKLTSTITDLNGKVSFYMSENARLHQQLTGNGDSGNPPAAVHLHHHPPPPPPYPYAWIPYGGYAMRPNGHPVPYVPIPRLKPQQSVSAPKAKKSSSESRKNGSKTKKVAGVSLLGLLLIMMVFGGLINFGFGRNSASRVSGGLSRDKGRILNVKGRQKVLNSTEVFSQFNGKIGRDNNLANNSRHQKEIYQNSSESLPALLYVPRNGKHVEINGNLIIHSVLASERAMMAQTKLKEEGKDSSSKKEDAGLAMTGNLASALVVPKGGRETGRHPKAYRISAGQPRALASDSHDTYRDNAKSTTADGPLQQWFREGLAGPILSSGTCTEVFQFEISPSSSAIVPAAASVVRNATEDLPPVKNKNRRIMYPLPISLNGSAVSNNTKQFGKPTESSDGNNNSTTTSMVVSVMADPREAGDGDADGMITPKALSRIFVVVLVDSVKYVTYSCMLPLKSHGPHLVN